MRWNPGQDMKDNRVVAKEDLQKSGPPCRFCKHFWPWGEGSRVVLCHGQMKTDFSCFVPEHALVDDQPRGLSLTILVFIKRYKEKHGFSPTIREMVDAIDMVTSTSVVSYHLLQLERKELISRVPGSPRTVVVLAEKQHTEGGK